MQKTIEITRGMRNHMSEKDYKKWKEIDAQIRKLWQVAQNAKKADSNYSVSEDPEYIRQLEELINHERLIYEKYVAWMDQDANVELMNKKNADYIIKVAEMERYGEILEKMYIADKKITPDDLENEPLHRLTDADRNFIKEMRGKYPVFRKSNVKQIPTEKLAKMFEKGAEYVGQALTDSKAVGKVAGRGAKVVTGVIHEGVQTYRHQKAVQGTHIWIIYPNPMDKTKWIKGRKDFMIPQWSTEKKNRIDANWIKNGGKHYLDMSELNMNDMTEEDSIEYVAVMNGFDEDRNYNLAEIIRMRKGPVRLPNGLILCFGEKEASNIVKNINLNKNYVNKIGNWKQDPYLENKKEATR